MATGAALGARLSSAMAPAATASSLPVLRSTFLSAGSVSLLRNYRLPYCYGPSRRFAPRKCLAQMSPTAVSSGMMSDLHESMVKLHVGVLQRVVDLGLPLPASDAGLSWWVLAVPVMLWYFLAYPGSFSGLLDYAYSPMHAASNIKFDPEDVEVGRQIGQGSFGVVFEGYIGKGKRKGTQKVLRVILKKEKPRSRGASEMQDLEVHMNRRVKRTAPTACADFLGTTKVIASQSRGRLSEGLWLVWRYEGDQTLAYYMKQRNFPENIADSLFGDDKESGTVEHSIGDQDSAAIRKITKQILICLRDLHKTGLVHRDVKPLNLILAEDTGKFKLIDLGAAVDLRSGYNYVPDETIIDPVYAAPEHHVMPVSTPQLPPDPLCSLISPVVWLLNTPDRFDLFSAGLILLQMAVKPLRQDIGLQTFNTELRRANYDLDLWRSRCRFIKEEFSILDADEGAGWELVRSMLQPRHDKDFFIWPSLGSSRPSAEAALKHRFITGSSLKMPAFKAPELPNFLSSLKLPAFSAPELPEYLTSMKLPAFKSPELPELSTFMKLPALSAPKLPSFSSPRKPPSVSAPELPELSSSREPPPVSAPKMPSFSSSMKSPSVSAPELSKPSSSMKLPALKAPELPALLTSFQPAKMVPKFSSDALPKLKPQDVGTGMLIAGASSLTLYTGWVILAALKDSAQKSYEVGQHAVEIAGITGAVSLASVVLFRVLLESQKKKRTNEGVNAIEELSAAEVAGNPINGSTTIRLRANSEGTWDQMPSLADPEAELSRESRIRDLLSSMQPGVRISQSKTGLAEAVQTMELQLASLESAIAASRLFALEQQEQIFQMEKLLINPRQEVGSGAKQSDN